jgi:3-deoxy-alpha-D-manno-octulosonate 8-oxidase
MINFKIFSQIPRLIYGRDTLKRISELMHTDQNCVLIYDSVFEKNSNVSFIKNSLNGIYIGFNATASEPKTEDVDNIVKSIKSTFKGYVPNYIIGLGGGSTLDIAKSVSILLTNEGKAEQYQGWDLVKNRPVPKIGIPTIFGSGSEASRTAVLSSPQKKQGINSELSMFDSIIIDPNLDQTLEEETRFFSAMDCYIHCVESLEGTMINKLSYVYASQGLELTKKYYLEDKNPENLAVASFLGGTSIVNSEVGICHALSYGISHILNIRHGLANCIVFNALEDFYGEHVIRFKEMLKKNNISLPKNVCKKLSDNDFNTMIDIAFLMERPLENALGTDWFQKFSSYNLKGLYEKM